MDRVKDLIGRVLRKRGLQNEAAAAHAVYLANAWIASAMPLFVSTARAINVKDNTLLIECTHSVAAQEVMQRAQELEKYLKKEVSIPLSGIRVLRSKSAAN